MGKKKKKEEEENEKTVLLLRYEVPVPCMGGDTDILRAANCYIIP